MITLQLNNTSLANKSVCIGDFLFLFNYSYTNKVKYYVCDENLRVSLETYGRERARIFLKSIQRNRVKDNLTTRSIEL